MSACAIAQSNEHNDPNSFLTSEELKDLLLEDKGLPRLCYAYLPTAEPGARIGLLRRGFSGYWQTDFDNSNVSGEFAQAMVNRLNGKLGVSKRQVAAMEIGSCFGWSCPGADPKNN